MFDPAFYDDYKHQFDSIHMVSQIEFDCIGANTYAYWHVDGEDDEQEICDSYNLLTNKGDDIFHYEDASEGAEIFQSIMREAWGHEDFDFGTC